jgi:hypothetical protein
MFEFGRELLGLGARVAIVQDEVIARRVQRARDHAPDPARSPRHQHHRTFVHLHGIISAIRGPQCAA